jgi:membrane protein required for beta-lactamase induction
VGCVERLSYWLSIIRWLPAVAGAIAVIAAVAVALVSNRLDTLRTERAANRHLSPTQQQGIARQLKQSAGTHYTLTILIDDSIK